MSNKNIIKMTFLEVINTMFKKRLSMIICSVLLAITCVGFVACGNDNGGGETQKPLHDSTKWFTEEELSAKGLAGLTAPTGLSGEMNSSDAWYNDAGLSGRRDVQDECRNIFFVFKNAL